MLIKGFLEVSVMKILYALLFAAVLLAAGCGRVLEQIPPEQIGFSSVKDKDILFNRARDVLEELHFVIEKSDSDAGYIKTRPLSGGEFFEFWRNDSIGAKNLAYSSIHTLHRIVEVNISPSQDGGFLLSCYVTVERLSMPSREVTGFADMPSAFCRGDSSIQRLKLQSKLRRQMRWVKIRDDSRLARYIEDKILREI